MLQIEKLLPTGIVLWCFLFPAICASSTLTGVRYSDHSGDSGTGTGEIQLAVRGRVYQLFYQKPYPQKFSNPACDDIGAIWSVEARLGHGHKGTLLKRDLQWEGGSANARALVSSSRLPSANGRRVVRLIP
jgi:hypothetical protein